jgi:hypothetical protein
VTLGIQIVGDDLGVQIVGDRDIVVTCPDSGIGRSSEPMKVKFWAQAWKAARQKARVVGWLSS